MARSSGASLQRSRSTNGRTARSSGASLSSEQQVDERLPGAVKWCESELGAADGLVIAGYDQVVRV
jgi:hypothetical protein